MPQLDICDIVQETLETVYRLGLGRTAEVPPENAKGSWNLTGGSRDQVVIRRMEGDADRGGDITVAGEMEGIRRLIDRVRSSAFRGRPVP